MTVLELFERFSAYFNKIVYFDETNNIEDCIEVMDCNNDVKTEEYDEFIDQYGSFEVLDWRFDNYNNNITVDIRRKWNNDNKTIDWWG